MDAASQGRETEKACLLSRLAEILIAEQREQGTFTSTPHFSCLEQASRSLGQELGRVSLARAAREVAAASDPTAVCPACGDASPVALETRTVHGLDGPVEILETHAHCSACRRAFFPSA